MLYKAKNKVKLLFVLFTYVCWLAKYYAPRYLIAKEMKTKQEMGERMSLELRNSLFDQLLFDRLLFYLLCCCVAIA